MRAALLHPRQDFDLTGPLPGHEQALTQDLGLGVLLRAMSGGDEPIERVSRHVLLSAWCDSVDTVLYRQAILQDCLAQPDVVRQLHAIAVRAVEDRKKHYFGLFARSPTSILSGAVDILRMLTARLRDLRSIADAHAGEFASPGFKALFAMLHRELDDAYFAEIDGHLQALKFRDGVLLSAGLGRAAEGIGHVLRQLRRDRRGWLRRLFGNSPPEFRFRLHERDEAGAQIVSALSDRGINLVANALAQSADHVLGFFTTLRAELAFYVGCLNLHRRLGDIGVPLAMPLPAAEGSRQLRFDDLGDACLALASGQRPTGNSLDANNCALLVITGANQGGKSTFLRSLGVAQLMMQAGMFVAAGEFDASLCSGLYTHFKREEDASMERGKFDEELARMSEIAGWVRPGALLLFNEPFASTNEREGSEIASQIVCALLEKRIQVAIVTHMYALASALKAANAGQSTFLRADRRDDGSRTFRLVLGEPLRTSFGMDLYREIFEAGAMRPESR